MKLNLKIFLLLPLVLISCQSYFEPIINEAAEKAVKEYGNSNPLAERVLEAVSYTHLTLPTNTPV